MSGSDIVIVLACALLAALVTWLVMRGRATATTVRLQERDQELLTLRSELKAAQEKERKASDDRNQMLGVVHEQKQALASQLTLLETAKAQFTDSFESLAVKVLDRNSDRFLEQASAKFDSLQAATRHSLAASQTSIDALVKPIGDELGKVKEQLQKFETERASAQGSLTQHLIDIRNSHGRLATETENLVKALRAPQVRGRWGEMQLKRVVELAGMLEHCDFQQQQSFSTADGKLRPDLIVRIPGNKIVVVDSKTPMAAYLDSMEAADDESRDAHLARHAAQVRIHIEALSAKGYADGLPEAPDFVVLFLPGESFFSAACNADLGLLDFAISRNIIPASPTTLITVLKAVQYGWQQERLGKNAEDIASLGREFYNRMAIFSDYLDKVRKGLSTAVTGYNESVASLESRVLPTVRKLKDLHIGSTTEIESLQPVLVEPRLPTSPELTQALSAGDAE